MTVVANPARTSDEEILRPDSNLSGATITVPSSQRPQARTNGPTEEHHVPVEIPYLYDDENRSDMVIIAGMNGDTSRFPVHRKALANFKPVFSKLADETSDIVYVNYVDRRGFEQLIRYQYSVDTELHSVLTCKLTLDAAYKFLVPQLAERCVRRLDEMLNVSVALEILRDLRFMCANIPGAASAPPLHILDSDLSAQYLSDCSRWCDSLAHNALLLIDECADEALNNELLYELPYEDLALIVKRDTLRVSSELILAKALSKWSIATCKRSKRELTPDNRRRALGELAYCPRYLLLKGDELHQALDLELLDAAERALVLSRVNQGKVVVTPTVEQEEMLKRFAQERPEGPLELPVELSERSKHPKPESSSCCMMLCGKRKKKQKLIPKVPSFAPETKLKISESQKPTACCSGFGYGLLRAFICLFD